MESYVPSATEMSRKLPAGTISAAELAHPLSRKGSKLLLKAQNYLEAGDRAKAFDTLHLALKESSAVPYARSILGTEYLKVGRVADVITELEEAVQLMPRHAPSLSNLGYALYLAGERERGEREVRKAFALDSGNSKTRFVLNLMERGRRQ